MLNSAATPLVSVVVATHNRPDTLHAALRSVLSQSIRDFELLVVGDACDERTLAVVRGLSDPRLRYINLPVWCGEQAIPNSIGMMVSTAPCIALLNHDDLWLPDHLEMALDALSRGPDFYMARSATAHSSRELGDGSVEPIFSELSDPDLRLDGVFNGQCFEPASAWVFRRDLIARVGPWRSARGLIDRPIDNWLKRAFRARVSLTVGQRVTVLKLQTHWARIRAGHSGAYGLSSPEHATLTRMLLAESAEAIRARVLDDVAAAEPPERPQAPESGVKARLRALKPWVYFHSGLDVDTLRQRLRGKRPGQWFEKITVARTGKPLPEAADFDALLAHAREQLRYAH